MKYAQGLALSLDDFTRLEGTVEKLLTLARLDQQAELSDEDVLPPTCSLREVVEEAASQNPTGRRVKASEDQVKDNC